MKKMIFVCFAALLLLMAACTVKKNNSGSLPYTEIKENNATGAADNKVKLTYMIHWNWDNQVNGLKSYLKEYSDLHPNVEFEIIQEDYSNYASKLFVLHQADAVPDIYQVYSSWGVSYVSEGMLDRPPADIVEDVKKNYKSTAGVTINNEIWGIPTEINDYSLVYDKAMFRDAGLVDKGGNVLYPKTWDELVKDAALLTKKDDKGNIVKYGFAFHKTEDWGVVDPFLSLLWSNGGKYLADDNSKALFNSPEGVEALDATLKLFKNGATDINGNEFDMGKGSVAMVIAPPWLEGTYKTNFGDRYENDLGVAPIPVLKKPATLQYSWFMGVMDKSKHKKEAWDFLRWFTTEVQPKTGTTRYGDLLAIDIGAIPSRNIDLENHKDILSSVFKNTYVHELGNSVPEPNVLKSSEIKKILMNEIVSAWIQEKSSKEALDTAKESIDKVLSVNKV